MLASASVTSATDDECRAFVAAQGADAHTSSELPAALAAAIDAGATAWPEIRVPREGFATFLGQRVPADVDPVAALASRKLADLYLVHACRAGDATACRILDEQYLSLLEERLVRQRIPAEVAAETMQQIRVRLLVGPRPLLLAYSGTGELRGWLRVMALRAAIRAQNRE